MGLEMGRTATHPDSQWPASHPECVILCDSIKLPLAFKARILRFTVVVPLTLYTYTAFKVYPAVNPSREACLCATG